jgi:hypothetical protein
LISDDEVGGLRSKCTPQFINYPIDLMTSRYRMSFMNDDDFGSFGDAFCIYQRNGCLAPFADWRNQQGAFDLRGASHENISKLNQCGIDLLHDHSPESSLREFESKSFFFDAAQ